jgi:Polysaccharide biosynthesis enzyme WcbI
VGIADAVRALLPDAEVLTWYIGVDPDETELEVAAQMPTFDLVVSQIGDQLPNSPLAPAALQAAGVTLIYQQPFVFTGFHPDCTYLQTPTGVLAGVAGGYHSVIAAAGFVLGFDVRRVCRLYNMLVFAELGYLDVYHSAQAALVASFADKGYDVAPMIARCLSEGVPYMHTINHPHISVIAALTHAMLVKAGLIDPGTPVPDNLLDGLEQLFVWPVYPAIARRLGVPGSTTFLRSVGDVTNGVSRELSLEAFVERSFAIYREADPDVLRGPAVAGAVARLQVIAI